MRANVSQREGRSNSRQDHSPPRVGGVGPDWMSRTSASLGWRCDPPSGAFNSTVPAPREASGSGSRVVLPEFGTQPGMMETPATMMKRWSRFMRINVNRAEAIANVAASANLPSLVMLLFWRGTTKQGITAAIFVGMLASLGWILLSQQCYRDVYGLPPDKAIVPFSQPGIVTIPLGFATLVVVSLLTTHRQSRAIA